LRLLLDINIVLDVVLGREPWALEASALLAALEEGRAEGYLAGHTITTVHYLVQKERGRRTAARAVSDLLRLADVVPLAREDFREALALGVRDFEDAVQAVCAIRIAADHMITRNPKDFRGLGLFDLHNDVRCPHLRGVGDGTSRGDGGHSANGRRDRGISGRTSRRTAHYEGL
jgi:predicted nucleic acid-binding protein